MPVDDRAALDDLTGLQGIHGMGVGHQFIYPLA